jgi:GT2 family glycosyltransferase
MSKTINKIISIIKVPIERFPSIYIASKIQHNGLKNTVNTIKGYNSIKKQDLFAEDYYLKRYPDVKRSNMDPLLHYIFYGFKESRKPNPQFDGNYYLKIYSDVNKSNLNPLIHYSLYGIQEGRKTIPTSYLSILKKKIDIVLCVHDALEDVKLCIQSIFRKTSLNYRLIIVNDGSGKNTTNYLKQVSNKHKNIILIENNEAEGYTKAANKGLKFSNADYVILLNSDTIVTNHWMENIVICGENNSKIGLIGPLSNAASYQSIPKIKNSNGDWAINTLIPGLTLDDFSHTIQKLSQKKYPTVPILNGFCLAVKRSVIDSIGYLDEENFPFGYGEENDYCLRAQLAGYKCVVADDTYIFHMKSQSFGHSERSSLSEKGWNTLKKKYGARELAKIIKRLEKNKKLEKIRENISDYLESNFKDTPLKSEFIKGKKEITANDIRIFIINDNYNSLFDTVNSIYQIQKKIPLTILTPENELNLTKNFENKLEIIEFDKKEGFINKINENLLEKKEKFVLFLHSGDKLEKDAISILNKNIDKKFAAILFDDNKLISDRIDSRFKPAFSYEYYLENDYIENSIWINRSKLVKIGGFDKSYSQNYIRDAILRLSEQNYKILKEDLIGLTLSKELDYDFDEIKCLLKNTLNRNRARYDIEKTVNSLKPVYRTGKKFASIIIPFKDQIEVTKKCIDSIFKLTKYSHYEILLINNNSIKKETKDYINKIKKNKKIRVLNYNQPFNYSKINNFAAKQSLGEILIFLNNDTEVISEHWLNELVGDALQHKIGAVGAKLYYPDGTLQHFGVVIGLNGLAGHIFAGENESELSCDWIKYRRNVSAVTGACMAINKKTFEEIGGFFEEFEITGNDVEICLRLMENGYRNIVNPEVKLIHHERKTRSKIKVRDKDIQLSIIAYQPYLNTGDPFFNKNFSLNSNSLITMKEEEYPVYMAFLDRYYKRKIKYDTKLAHVILDNKKSSKIKLDKEVLTFDVSPLDLEKNQEIMIKFKRNPQLELNKTLWFIPFFDHVYRGGIYTIFRTAQHFSIKEGTKNIFVLKGGKERNLTEIEKELSEAFPKLNFELINIRMYGNEEDLPYSDAAFCTLWTTAFSLVKYNNCKSKFYFNQDFEPMFYAAGSVYGLIEQTYRFGFIGITNTEGVAEKYKKYEQWVNNFTPAIDKKKFYPTNEKLQKKKKRVVFYGRPQNPRNGFRLGIEALKIVKSYFGKNVEIFSVGSEFNKSQYELDGILENLGLLPTIEDVAELYRTCDVGLVFMFTPHPSYQPLEYMASGCATVTNINENNLWLLRDKENTILTEPTVSCVANSIIEMLENDSLRSTIIRNGLKTISFTNWENELDKTIEFIKNPKIRW